MGDENGKKGQKPPKNEPESKPAQSSNKPVGPPNEVFRQYTQKKLKKDNMEHLD